MYNSNKNNLKQLKKKHEKLMNKAFKLAYNEKEKRKQILKESSFILLKILYLESTNNQKKTS